MNSPSQLPQQEVERLLQSVQMFEALTRSNPEDCNSLEMLKEAYWQLGYETHALEVMRRLADAHMRHGQYGAALLEYESLQLKHPGDHQLSRLAAEAKEKLAATANLDSKPEYAIEITADELAAVDIPTLSDEGNSALAQFLLEHQLAPEALVHAALQSTLQANRQLKERTVACSLLEQIAKEGELQIDLLLSGLLDKLKCPYLPLEQYDVDWQIVKMLPENLSLRRLIVPFDMISHTLMVAMANPMDSLGKQAVEQLLDYDIQWHLASPVAIAKVLRSTYHLEEPTK